MAGRLLSSIRQILTRTVNSKRYESHLHKMQVVEVTPGRCVCELELGEEHTNPGGTLHGGLTALLVDKVTTLALQANQDGVGGASVDMHITYLTSAQPGDAIIIDAVTEKYGKTLAFLRAELRHKEKGHLIAWGTHTKYVANR